MNKFTAILSVAIALSTVDMALCQQRQEPTSSVAMPPSWEPGHNIRYFVPNDPLFPSQWHLDNLVGDPHVNVSPAWASGITGSGVTIGIVDDGLQHAHPDLAPNYVAADSWDFGGADPDPSPVHSNIGPGDFSGDNHGTSVAGVAAARGGNALGVTGAAPDAGLAGLRIDFPTQTSAMFAGATLFHSDGVGAFGSNIQVKNHSYGIAVPYIDTSLEVTALKISASNGTIHTFAAGNERSLHSFFIDVNDSGGFTPDIDLAIDGDANKKHTQSVQESIAVAALGHDGGFASYSNWGANVFVTAPSSGAGLGITTTDRTAGGVTGGYNHDPGGGVDGDPLADLDYMSTFGGTSSASPLVAGIMALGQQVLGAMDERTAKHLMVSTNALVDALDATITGGGDGATPGSAWITNAAGNAFNMNYGFGLVDADAFTTQAALVSGVTPLVTETTGTLAGGAIPDAGFGPLTKFFSLATPGTLEEVELTLDISHTWRGDIEAYLTSPLGTTSRLMHNNGADSFNSIDWTFVTNAFWGENPVGTWTLDIFDTFGLDTGTLNDYSVLAKTGSLIAIPEPGSIVLLLMALCGLRGSSRSGR